jgi:receptor protein-tyrosine kinase
LVHHTRAHEAHQITLGDYLKVVRRRKWIILSALVLVPAAAVAFSLHQTKLYQANAEVLLSRQNLAASLTGTQDTNIYQQADRLAQTQADLARVPEVAQRTLRRVGLRARTPEQFLASSSVTAKQNADLLRLTVTDRNQALASRLATAYAQSFAAYRKQLDTGSLQRARAELQDRVNALERAGDTRSQLYSSLVEKEQTLGTMIALQTGNVQPVKPADRAVQVQPKPTRNGILGLALGLVLGIGLAFLWEALDTRVRGAEQVGETLGLPLLGRLPIPPRKIRAQDKLVMVDEPHAIHAEAFRTLRVNIDFANIDLHARTIMLTSATASEGKSTTAANLGVAMARAGKRVVLIDLDLRRPYVARFFDFGRKPGLTDVALGYATLEDATLSVALSTTESAMNPRNGNGANGHGAVGAVLDVIASGPVPPDGGDFVGSRRVVEIIDRLRDAYDVVLIDAPPLLGVGDAMALSARVDAVLVVTKLKAFRKPTLTELARVLSSLPAAKLGFVVTGVEQGDAHSYGYSDHYLYAREGDHVGEPVR